MHLIIQGKDPQTHDLKQLAKLSGATSIERICPTAFRLRDAQTSDGAAALCDAAQLDFALVPANNKLRDIGLVVMDMDSTLIAIECIDEIADMQGIKGEVAAITASAMRGEIDFRESLTRRVALLAGLDASALQRVYDERLTLTPGAEKMLAKMHAAGIKSLLVSGGFTFFTNALKARLQLDYAVANTLEIASGKFTGNVLGDIIDAEAKAIWLERIRKDLNLKKEQVVAIGDGANDLAMMACAGTSVAYRAKPVVRERASYALNYNGLDAVLNFFK